MATIQLPEHRWDSAGIFDRNKNKNQRDINAELYEIIPTIDNTLSQDGAAADAKVVGDSIANIQAANQQTIANETENWLQGNIAQETGYVLDSSLTVAGAAADAKTVGDKFEEISSTTSKFDDLFKRDINWSDYGTSSRPNGWVAGSYSNADGTTSATARYGRSIGKFVAPENCQYLFVSSYSDSYGIIVAEYDKNGTFITSHGSGVGSAKTVTQFIKVYPNHQYGFSVGIFPSGQSTSTVNTTYLTDENVNNIKAYFLTSVKDGIYPEEDISENCIKSTLGGHVVEYKTIGKPMEIYKDVNGQPEYSFSVPASDYIRCNPNYTYTLRINSSNESAKYYINIYDESHNIAFERFKIVNGDGIINCFTAQELANYNGFQFSNIPDGYYIRYSISPYDAEYRMYVWDGVKCGLPLCSQQGSFNENTYEDLPSSGECIVTIPGGVKCVIAKPGYTFFGGRSRKNNSYINFSDSEFSFPSQIFQSNINTDDENTDESTKALIIRKNYNYTTKKYDSVGAECDMSPYMCVVPLETSQGVFSTDNGFGRVAYITRRVKDIEGLTWECKKNIGSFKKDVTYRGVPYYSEWTAASLFGWHVSSKTFINAANDPDSVFYNNSNNQPYYSLVCSSYGSLVSLFPYPLTNYSMMHDPNVNIVYSNDMEIGALMSNGAPDGNTSASRGHCIIPLSKTQNADSKLSAITIAESSGKVTRRRNGYSFYSEEDKDVAQGAYGFIDLRNYVYNVQYLKNIYLVPPYRIAPVFEPTNGSARPHKGDCGVYTSYGTIVINVKDQEADRIYYQKVSCNFSSSYPGIPQSVSDAGTAKYILFSSIDAANKSSTTDSLQIKLRFVKSNGNFYGAIKDVNYDDLESGAIYAVWASNGESTRPNNGDTESQNKYELFEWYEIRTDESRIYYDIEDGKLVIYSKKNGVYVKANNTDNIVDFWYIRTFGTSVGESIRDSTAGFVSIPYEENNDYSKYAEKFIIPLKRMVNNNQVDNDVYFYRKGKLGAYYQQGIILARAYADDLKNEKILWNNIPWDNYPEQLQNNIDEKLRDDVSNGKLTAAKYESITGKSYNS